MENRPTTLSKMKLLSVLVVLASYIELCRSDFICICNYNVEKPVYPSQSTQSQMLGYMYEFDCKPMGENTSDPQWIAVDFQNQVGYVETDKQIEVQTCPGDPAPEDKLTTTSSAVSSTVTVPDTPSSTTPSSVASTSLSTPSTVVTEPSTASTLAMSSTTSTETSTMISTQPVTTISPTEPTTGDMFTTEPTTIPTSDITSSMLPESSTTTLVTSTQSMPQSTVTDLTTGDMSTTEPTTIPTTEVYSISTASVTFSTATSQTETSQSTASPTSSTTASTTSSTTASTTTETSSSVTSAKPTSASTTTSTTTSSTQVTDFPTSSSTTPPSTVYTAPYTEPVTYGCPDKFLQMTLQEKGTLFTYGHNCYEIVPMEHSFGYAENDCQTRGGHLVHITNSSEQAAIYQVVSQYHGDHVWIGLSDRQHEERFTWTSGDLVDYTNWIPGRKDPLIHGFEDCVTMRVGSYGGKWEDERCTHHYGYICEFDGVPSSQAATTAAPSPFGEVHLCPAVVQQASVRYGYILSQYKDSCYELHPRSKVTWRHSESLCRNRGGHLTQIGGADEQAFVQKFLLRTIPSHAVWLGLHDINTEGYFEWTDGMPVNYTNWVTGHLDNYANHRQEDCVALIPYKGGVWDDIPCGQTGLFGGDVGETHYTFCEYSKTQAIKYGIT